jgi:hypothetical protein
VRHEPGLDLQVDGWGRSVALARNHKSGEKVSRWTLP